MTSIGREFANSELTGEISAPMSTEGCWSAIQLPMPMTFWGVLGRWPSPSCSFWLLPQHVIVLLSRRAQVWELPAVMAVASDKSATFTGRRDRSVVPSPSWPSPLLPQQLAVPSS